MPSPPAARGSRKRRLTIREHFEIGCLPAYTCAEDSLFYMIPLTFSQRSVQYAFYGGMPLILSRPDETAKKNYLKSLFSEVYLKDIKYEACSDSKRPPAQVSVQALALSSQPHCHGQGPKEKPF